ncbi:hypothetical protein DSM104299_04816 [Baekduia alba]|uniref:hypothetical protein n=1 Tax=Baekduia alba TaxID=2997333 RepID=UPI0023406612|nr:hypothetical protein [Baekduia alba]WCB96062.1 hypothetical protein DSM104299_04816 [Baekduia alba]
MDELRPGLHRWTARHPDWHPNSAFGAEVASFALQTDDRGLLLLDPLVPDDAPDLLDALATEADTIDILITIGYHARSAEALSERYDRAPIRGPENVRRRLTDPSGFRALTADAPGPAGATALAIGRPRRSESPIWFPTHQALAFGDALVTTPDGALRMWCQEPVTDQRAAFYRERFAPTLEPLVGLRPRHVLTTHGAPILDDGAAALAKAAADAPWYHRS